MADLVRARLEFERAEPLHGLVVGEDGVTREFVGWLDFYAALDALPASGGSPEPDPPALVNPL